MPEIYDDDDQIFSASILDLVFEGVVDHEDRSFVERVDAPPIADTKFDVAVVTVVGHNETFEINYLKGLQK